MTHPGAGARGLACDTSVLVPAIVTWHPRHEDSRRAVTETVTALPSHVLVETYSVLTRLPAPHRLSPAIAGQAVAGIGLEVLTLPGAAQIDMLGSLAEEGVRGGATYDGLVAATAKHHGLALVTADRRAQATYATVGVDFQILTSRA